MVTGVEEEMKVTSSDDKKQQDKQPTETRDIKSANRGPFISQFPRSNPPKIILFSTFPSLFCLSSARCLSLFRVR